MLTKNHLANKHPKVPVVLLLDKLVDYYLQDKYIFFCQTQTQTHNLLENN